MSTDWRYTHCNCPTTFWNIFCRHFALLLLTYAHFKSQTDKTSADSGWELLELQSNCHGKSCWATLSWSRILSDNQAALIVYPGYPAARITSWNFSNGAQQFWVSSSPKQNQDSYGFLFWCSIRMSSVHAWKNHPKMGQQNKLCEWKLFDSVPR